MFRLVGAYSTVGCIKAMEDFRCVELPNSARIKNGDNFRQDSFRPVAVHGLRVFLSMNKERKTID